MSERFRVVGVDELPDEIKARVECGYNTYAALVEFDGDRIVDVVAWDGGEPEDQTLWRDWSWIAPWASGIADALAREKARADEEAAGAAAMREALEAWLDEAREPPHEGTITETHWEDCPKDDTCECELPAMVKAALASDAGRALLAELTRLREALRPFVEQSQPVSVPEVKAVGGEWVEVDNGDEWVCCGCGEYGDSATTIAHKPDCDYERGRAALTGERGGEGA